MVRTENLNSDFIWIMVSNRDKKTIKLLVVFKITIIAIFVIIVFVPFIPVENTVQIVCVTTPCEDMVVVENQTILEFVFGIRSDGEIPEPSPDEVFCIQQFDPVCTISGTFSNQCEADVAGAITLYKGECP